MGTAKFSEDAKLPDDKVMEGRAPAASTPATEANERWPETSLWQEATCF